VKAAFLVAVEVLVVCAGVWAADGGVKPSAAKAAQQSAPELAGQLRQLENEIADQQQQLQEQRIQILDLQKQLQQGIHQQNPARGKDGDSSDGPLAASQRNIEGDLKGQTPGSSQAFQDIQNRLQQLEHPTGIHYKGITFTPGGFLTADVLVRNRNENADVTSNFGAVPFGGIANSHLSEFRASARASRLSLLAEGMAGPTKLTAYYEVDFMGQAPTANQVETNSFTPRQRQLWAQAAFRNGVTFTGGQFWSLITTDRKGIATRAEFLPNTIEASYVVGYDYVRQTAFRLTDNFNDRLWAAVEIANPETNQPSASYVPPNLFGFNNSPNASSPSGSTLNFLSGSTNGFSTNLAPDLLTKVAWEPGWGHYEFKTLLRFFRDRINGQNNVSVGGGLGAAAILPLVPKKADFILEGLAGAGIGRYGAANGSDISLRPDGKIVPLHAFHILSGLELHLRPNLDAFAYGGDEYYRRAPYLNPADSTKPAGYGSPLVDNTDCGLEVIPPGAAACGAQNKNVWEATTGFWYRFYRGPHGTLQYGLQYEYLHRTAWSGIGGTPKGLDSVVLSSFRYLIP
jgi:hypothetical protein